MPSSNTAVAGFPFPRAFKFLIHCHSLEPCSVKVVIHSSSLWLLLVAIVFGLSVSRVRRNPEITELEPNLTR